MVLRTLYLFLRLLESIRGWRIPHHASTTPQIRLRKGMAVKIHSPSGLFKRYSRLLRKSLSSPVHWHLGLGLFFVFCSNVLKFVRKWDIYFFCEIILNLDLTIQSCSRGKYRVLELQMYKFIYKSTVPKYLFANH